MAARCKTTENDDQVRTSHRRGPMGRLWQWDTDFLVSVISGRGVICCRRPASVLLFPCVPLSAMMADQSGIVFFQMSQCLKMKSESWSKWNGRENGSAQQVGNAVKLNRFLSLCRVGCVSFSSLPPMPDKNKSFCLFFCFFCFFLTICSSPVCVLFSR